MTHIIAHLFHLSTASAWRFILSLIYMASLFIVFLIAVRWKDIKRAFRRLIEIAGEVMKAHDEWERSLPPGQRAHQDDTNLFI